MRIRYKKWARPELEASKFYEDNPEEYLNVNIKLNDGMTIDIKILY